MKEIIGKRGNTIYLISLGTKIDPNTEKEQGWGEVIDLDQKKVFGPDYLSVWYSHGTWEPFDGDQSIVNGLYDHVTRAN